MQQQVAHITAIDHLFGLRLSSMNVLHPRIAEEGVSTLLRKLEGTQILDILECDCCVAVRLYSTVVHQPHHFPGSGNPPTKLLLQQIRRPLDTWAV